MHVVRDLSPKWRLQDRPKGCVFVAIAVCREHPVSFAFHLGLRDVSVYMSSVGLASAPRVFTKVL